MIAVTFRPPTESDLDALGATMRAMDVMECRAVSGLAPREALAEAVADSLWAYAAEIDGEVVCIFGVAPDGLLGEEAAPWMLCAEGIEHHAKAVMLCSKRFLLEMQAQFERLANVVHADNRSAIRFLKWCGFSFGETMMIEGEPFLVFEWRREALKAAA